VKRSQRHAAARALALAGVVTAAPAHAQQPAAPEATRLEFRAPAGCSSAGDFAARVSRRTARIRLVADPGVRRSLLVEVQQASPTSSLRGIVTVIEADGATRTRRLKAATCEEVVDALSLIATVTLDPDALSGEPPPDIAPAPPKAEPAPTPAKPARPAREPPPFHHTPPSDPYRFSFGLGGALLLQMAPEVAPGASASAAFEINPGYLAAPFWRLSVTHAERRALSEPGGKASFAFTLPTVDACPVRLGPRALGLRPCAFASLGVLSVSGDGTPRNETHARWYGAAGVAAWLGWRISEAFEIIADGRAGLPFRRDRFAFDGTVFFKTPTPGFSLGLGAAGGFP